MGQLVQIHWTCGSLDEARKVSRFLVQERFVACANIIPWVESVYMWEGELHTDQETKVIFKTIEEKFSAVVKAIKDNTSYEVPEISKLVIDEANEDYVSWVDEVLEKTLNT
jgi:periplasmic divalent cation tolerance protein